MDGSPTTPPADSVVFVIPALDEEGAIAEVVRAAIATGLAREVLVVDDGSMDRTAERAEEAGARVVRLGRNQGKGVALREGVRAAGDADVVILIDGDGQDDPAEAIVLLQAIAAGADLAIGSRFMGTLEPGAITPINYLGNRALTGLMALLYGRGISDSQAGFRAIRKAAWDRLPLRSIRYDVETEVLARALRAGLNVVEVGVSRAPRAAGQSKLGSISTGLRVLRTMVRCRFA